MSLARTDADFSLSDDVYALSDDVDSMSDDVCSVSDDADGKQDDVTLSVIAARVRDDRFGSKVGQIGRNWDKTSDFFRSDFITFWL